MSEESAEYRTVDDLAFQQSENETETIERNDEISNDAALKKKTKRKNLSVTESLAISSETINEIDASEAEYAIVQRANKRQKIEISTNKRKTYENGSKSHNDDGLVSSKPPLSSVKQPKDGKSCIETNKLRLKYENIHTNTVQKLNAQAEQLRMEISTLRTALANEQNAVRVLR